MKKFVILLFALCIGQSAFAYNLTQDFRDGFYWSSLPVNFLVMDTDPNRLQLISDIAQEAVAEWEDVIVQNLWNVDSRQGSPVSNTNIIRWSTNFASETGLNASTTLAVAIRYSRGPYIARAEIVLNGNHVTNSDPEDLKGVLVHELGHILGLDHSDTWGAVMYATFNTYRGLHWDDVSGMNYTVGETKRRQAIGYVSPLSRNETSSEGSPLSCGTVDLSGGGGSGPGGSSQNPIYSLGFGLMLALAAFAPGFKSKRG
jgi:hypothetical protein